jgi:hypothetical protein
MFRHLLVREIGVWLAIKLAALTAIFLLFFGPEQRLDVSVEHDGAYDSGSVAGAEGVPGPYTSSVRIFFDQ